jgi:hypothetical protein
MWQRALDLHWFPRRPGRRSRFSQTKRDIADRKPDISRPPDGPYHYNLWQTLSEADEGQPDDEVAETRSLAEAETYPLINRNPLSPPTTMMGLLDTIGESPFAAGDNALPLHTSRMLETPYLKEPAGPLNLTVKKRPIRTAAEAYPVIVRDLFLSPVARVSLSDTTPEPLRRTRATASSMPPDSEIIDGPEAEGGAAVVPPSVEPTGSVITPAVYQSYQIRDTDLEQTKTVGNERGDITKQPHRTYLGQTLSRLLKPIMQRMTFQRKPVEANPQIYGKGIGEGHAFSIQKFNYSKAGEKQEDSGGVTESQANLPFVADTPEIRVSGPPTVKAADRLSTLANLKPPATLSTLANLKPPPTLRPKSIIHGSPARSGPPVSGDSSKLRLSIIPRIGPSFGGLVSNTMLPEALTYREGSEVLPNGISRRLVSPAGQSRRQEPSVSSSMASAGHKDDAVYQAKGTTARNQNSDTLNRFTTKHVSTGQGFPGGHVRSEEYVFPYHQGYVPSSPGSKYAHQPALELSVASSIGRKASVSLPPGEELFKNMYTTIPELTSSRYPNMPELALAPAGAAPVTASSRIARAEGGGTEGREREGEYMAAPDIDAIAHDVYGILKRRLMAERERALGVY